MVLLVSFLFYFMPYFLLIFGVMALTSFYLVGRGYMVTPLFDEIESFLKLT
jgi:hypothetical protein